MNKKYLYSLIFASIFVFSTISVVTPVSHGYTFGVPDMAKDMDVEAEVMEYDKDLWGDALGGHAEDTVNYKFGGEGTSANDVGAKSKMTIDDWEDEEIWLFGDLLMESDVAPKYDGSPSVLRGVALTDYWSAAELMEEAIGELGMLGGSRNDSLSLGVPSGDINYYNDLAGFGKPALFENFVVNAITLGNNWSNPATNAFMTGINQTLYEEAKLVSDLFAESTLTREEISARYSERVDCVVLTADSWDFAKDGDFDSNPDEKEKEIPFIKDPHDVYESFKYFNSFLNEEMALLDAMIDALIAFNQTYQATKALATGPSPNNIWYQVDKLVENAIWNKVNASKGGGSANMFIIMLGGGIWDQDGNAVGTPEYGDPYDYSASYVDTMIDAILKPDGTHVLQRVDDPENPYYLPGRIPGDNGLFYYVPYFTDKAPLDDGKAYLAKLFQKGLPAHQGVRRWLKNVLEDFNVDEDAYHGDNFVYRPEWGPDIGGLDSVTVIDNLHKGGFTIEEDTTSTSPIVTVTVEYEWAEGVLGVDMVNQREDYKIIYTYKDTGTQGSVEFVSDHETFWKKDSLSPSLPGYEIPILLGVAAISALSLVFIVMKKKRM